MENGKIYCVSSKFDFGKWGHRVYVFTSKEKAEKWLHTEEEDFREREIMDSRESAIELAGKEAVEEAEEEIY